MILIKGIGSIGKRHLTNLMALGYTDIALVTSKSKPDTLFNNLPAYPSVAEACQNHRFSHGFICSPTASHYNDLKDFVKYEIPNIYLEKPVNHQLADFSFVDSYLESGGNIAVGYDLHFDPGLMKVRELILSGAIGQILSANAFVGQYLPDWRPHEDHRKGMSASKEKGGGVMLDLVHEFDYLCWLLGEPEMVAAFYQHNPELEIETEDVADVLLRFNRNISATIHLDYHQRQLIRNCVITGTRGTITWDLALRKVFWLNASKENNEFDFSTFDRNDRFVEIVKSFMNGRGDERLCSFSQGVKSLRLVLAAKLSCEQLSFINPSTIKH